MTYATHKAGGALFALAGFEILSKTGLLVSDIEPWMALILMYPASSFGSTFPDLDHSWDKVKEHTPTNAVIHKLLHITHPHHRSWQTHSLILSAIEIALIYLVLWLWKTYQWFNTSPITISILYLIITGFSLGIASHLFLDMFTRAGIWIIPGMKAKIRLVPDDEKFSCGDKNGSYETIWRVILYILTALLCIWILNPFGLQQVFVNSATV